MRGAASAARLLLAGALLGPLAARGAVFHVHPQGSDQAPGTLEQPFATLQRGHEAAEPGDTVLLRGGLYSLGGAATGVTLSKSGGPGQPIRIFAYGDERPVFDGSGLGGTGQVSGLRITGSWLHLRGLEVRNVPAPRGTSYGVWVRNAHDNILEQLTLHGHQGPGLFIDGGTGGHLVLNCDSYDNYDPHSRTGPGQNADGFGCHYQRSGASTVFRGCRAWWNSDDGYDWMKQEVPVIIEHCWAMGSGYTPNGGPPAASGNGAGFKMGNTYTGVRHVIRQCVSIRNKVQGFYANHSHGGSDWLNNTAYANRGPAFDMLSDIPLSGDKVHRLRNNVALPGRFRNMGQSDQKNNSWDLETPPDDQAFESVSDQGFLGPRQPDGSLPDLKFLKLRPGSLLIDQGTPVGLPFKGKAPDLGAFEF